ncbi:BPG_G0031060.mRNA.1.CDS.1 [Saccharomyces cerevisiae]|mgnify:CR=1 FL=1|nr:BPG_G0031060.mRNA.1.CDS.1 [Saccharomyces cerevisiae]CAI7192871.1 BPG_G0031060.mRNA.1.CDS.1 [Saccharomyces cerevisiae]
MPDMTVPSVVRRLLREVQLVFGLVPVVRRPLPVVLILFLLQLPLLLDLPSED